MNQKKNHHDVAEMSPEEFEKACQEAVRNREDIPTMKCVTRFDKETETIKQTKLKS